MPARIALFIDAENISYNNLPDILKEVPSYGELTFRAVYGDWGRPNLQKWREIAEKHKFEIRHQTSNKIKNSSDMKLIMDAMEALYKTPIDIFCVVTNDADYVPLCDKVREAKKRIIGMGNVTAADVLVRACDTFIFIGREGPIQSSIQSLIQASTKTSTQVPKPATLPKTKSLSKQATPIKPAAPKSAPKQTVQAKQPTAPKQAVAPKKPETLPKPVALPKSAIPIPAKQSTAPKQAVTPKPSPPSAVAPNPAREPVGAPKPSTFSPLTKQATVSNLPSTPTPLVTSMESMPQPTDQKLVMPPHIGRLLSQAFERVSHDTNGWVLIAALGNALRQLQADFQTNIYGYGKLTELLQSMPTLVELREDIEGNIISTRLKNNAIKPVSILKDPEKLLSRAFAIAPHDTMRWVTLRDLDEAINKVQPGVQVSIYGYSTLIQLLQSMPKFVELRGSGGGASARLKK